MDYPGNTGASFALVAISGTVGKQRNDAKPAKHRANRARISLNHKKNVIHMISDIFYDIRIILHLGRYDSIIYAYLSERRLLPSSRNLSD